MMMIIDMAAKIEFFQLREDAHLKADLTRKDIGKFVTHTVKRLNFEQHVLNSDSSPSG